MADNVLYYGDNLDVLRRHIRDESVDLVYLDPPFKSDQNYNVLFEEQDGSRSTAQIKVFEDTWEWNQTAAAAFEEAVTAGGPVSRAMEAYRTLLDETDMLAYLSMMAPRLVELRRVMKPTASIYLHCDATASAHLRLLMDAVFGPKNLRNEIHWYYYNKMHDRRKNLFARATDTLLFYVKDVTDDFTFHQLKEKRDTPIKQLLRKKVKGRMVNVKGKDGKVLYRTSDDRGVDNVWRIPCLQPAAQERLGYPTQKPVALLERIILASSNEGDVVLDPFCGCGTAIIAAENLKRHWIGIDVTSLAISLIKHRLAKAFGDSVSYSVIGEPTTIEEATQLASEDKHQFEWWALSLVNARPADPRKGADRGIDGRLVFLDGLTRDAKHMLFSVKGGHVTVSQLRDLRGVLEREKAAIGVFISLEEPTLAMRREAASAGFVKSAWGKHSRLQLLTVAELLAGKRIDAPATEGTNVTYRSAPKAFRMVAEHPTLFDADDD